MGTVGTVGAVIVLLALGALAVAVGVACEPSGDTTAAAPSGRNREPPRLALAAPLLFGVLGSLTAALVLGAFVPPAEGGMRAALWWASLSVLGAGLVVAFDMHARVTELASATDRPRAMGASGLLATGVSAVATAALIGAALHHDPAGAGTIGEDVGALSLGAMVATAIRPRGLLLAALLGLILAPVVVASGLGWPGDEGVAAVVLSPLVALVFGLAVPATWVAGPHGRSWLTRAAGLGSMAAVTFWMVPRGRAFALVGVPILLVEAVLSALRSKGVARWLAAAATTLAGVVVVGIAAAYGIRSGLGWALPTTMSLETLALVSWTSGIASERTSPENVAPWHSWGGLACAPWGAAVWLAVLVSTWRGPHPGSRFLAGANFIIAVAALVGLTTTRRATQ